ncbi:Ig-like domain-containing protein [Dehalococcoidia bacterium]|nr:Ig-like domain-containing protein [Dehalococcoidia bacterium]
MPGRYEATARVLFDERVSERSISLRIIPRGDGVLAGIIESALTGLPLDGALVEVIDPVTNQVISESMTDAEGRYEITLDEGVYDLRISLFGYLGSYDEDVTLDAGVIVNADFSLQPTITLEPLVALTNIPSQLLTGAVQAGVTVEFTTEPEAVFGEVAYPTPLTWECGIELSEGENVITVIATINDAVVGRVEARITLDTVAPALTTVPEDGATDVALDVDIAVTFSEAMDEALAEEAFSIEPAVSGIFRWVENTMIFEPDVDLEYGTTYTVTISTLAKDLAGNPLAAGYTWSFTTLTAPLNWALIGGIISAVVVIVGSLVYFLVIRGKKGRQAGVRGVEPP